MAHHLPKRARSNDATHIHIIWLHYQNAVICRLLTMGETQKA